MDHGAAQIFGARLSLGLAKRDFMSGAVVLRDDRMLDRDIGGALVLFDLAGRLDKVQPRVESQPRRPRP